MAGEAPPADTRGLRSLCINARALIIRNFYQDEHRLAAGENPKVVSERLGYASIVLGLDAYSHILSSMQQAATEKLETILFARTESG